MNILTRICQRLEAALNILIVVLLGLLVLDVCWQVITRFIMQQPSSFTDEAARFLLIWLSLFGAAAAYRQGMHLGIDVFVKRFSGDAQLRLATLSNFFVLVFALAILVYGGSKLVQLTAQLQQTSAVLGVQMSVIYLALPISGIIFSLFAIDFMVNPKSGLRLNMDQELEASNNG